MRALLAACLLLAPATGQAQLPPAPADPSDADVAVARDAYVEGVRYAERRRWARALEAFERSYRLSGSAAALFNLGSTLRSLERYTDAREAFDRLLEHPLLDDETRARAERLRAEVTAQIGRLIVARVPPGPADVLVDGRIRAQGSPARPVEVELDPGLRVVRVELSGLPAWTWSGEIEAGDTARAAARFEVEGAPAPPPPAAPDETDWAPIVAVIIGLAAVGIGGLIVGLAVGAEEQLDPRTDLVIRLP